MLANAEHAPKPIIKMIVPYMSNLIPKALSSLSNGTKTLKRPINTAIALINTRSAKIKRRNTMV
jgi:hypothetical protein